MSQATMLEFSDDFINQLFDPLKVDDALHDQVLPPEVRVQKGP